MDPLEPAREQRLVTLHRRIALVHAISSLQGEESAYLGSPFYASVSISSDYREQSTEYFSSGQQVARIMQAAASTRTGSRLTSSENEQPKV